MTPFGGKDMSQIVIDTGLTPIRLETISWTKGDIFSGERKITGIWIVEIVVYKIWAILFMLQCVRIYIHVVATDDLAKYESLSSVLLSNVGQFIWGQGITG